jgi:hypothetical protein
MDVAMVSLTFCLAQVTNPKHETPLRKIKNVFGSLCDTEIAEENKPKMYRESYATFGCEYIRDRIT